MKKNGKRNAEMEVKVRTKRYTGKQVTRGGKINECIKLQRENKS